MEILFVIYISRNNHGKQLVHQCRLNLFFAKISHDKNPSHTDKRYQKKNRETLALIKVN
jgi:hypothetical protein